MQAIAKLKRIKDAKDNKNKQYKTTFDCKRFLKDLESDPVRKAQTPLNISEKQFISLCRKTKAILLSQPGLLRLSGPIIISTGTLGYIRELSRIFRKCGQPSYYNYLFLGDYAGRGKSSIQCLVFLFSNKIEKKNNFFLLRGCYQTIAMARSSQLYSQILQRFSPKAWAQVTQVFCSLPFAAVVDEQIFCVHGGISPQLRTIQEINRVKRPCDTPQIGMLCDLIWSDPTYKAPLKIDRQSKQNRVTVSEYEQSERGFGFTFTHEAAETFLQELRLEMICRAHEVIYDGFQMSANKKIATICTLANYCGIFNNSSAVMNVDDEVNIYFRVVKEKEYYPNQLIGEDYPQTRLHRIVMQKYKKKEEKKKKQAAEKAAREEQFKKQQIKEENQEEEKEKEQEDLKEEPEEPEQSEEQLEENKKYLEKQKRRWNMDQIQEIDEEAQKQIKIKPQTKLKAKPKPKEEEEDYNEESEDQVSSEREEDENSYEESDDDKL